MSFFKKTPPMSTDDAAIRELLTRGVERIFPDPGYLEKELRSGRRLRLYLGIDPTGPTLHMGHVIPLLKLRQFQKLGHHIILLIGDFTAQIGDPTDKTATRVRLTHDEVLHNAKLYKMQAERILSFSGAHAAELAYNALWLEKLSFGDVVEVMSNLTHADMVKRDMFQKRIAEGKEIYMHEFLYPLMQGYDSVAMDVDGEVGGNDQTFNMLVGRDLMKRMKKKEKFVLAMKLLTDSAGAKMGKTEGNLVALSDTLGDIFGKIMSWPDGMILMGLELCTGVELSEIEEAKKRLDAGVNPRDEKIKLAKAVVSLLHGTEAAEKAAAAFSSAFKEGKPEEYITIETNGREIGDVLAEKGIVGSKSKLRTLIAEGAITNIDTGEKMGEGFIKSASPGRYRIGKHRFIQIC